MSNRKNNLSNVLFSRVKQQLLGLFYLHPNNSFHTNEIIRQTRMGTGSIQRELKKLTDIGLINITVLGNQKRYQVNQNFLFFTELNSIILKSFGLADILLQALKPLSKKINAAFVYGSIAKKEDTTHSDVDIMIIGNDLIYADFLNLFEKIEKKMGRKINPTIYTPADWQRKLKAGNHSLAKVMQETKIYLIGTEDVLKNLR